MGTFSNFWRVCCVLTLATPGVALAAGGNGTVGAKTISAIAIAQTADLDFGIIIPTSLPGTVTVDAQTSGRTSSGGAIIAGGTVSAAKFLGAATAGTVVTFSINPTPAITLNRVGGGATMTINQLRLSKDGGAQSPFGPNHTMGLTGAVFLGIGGRLNVGPNQTEGVYTASFTVTMDYQ